MERAQTLSRMFFGGRGQVKG